jgi:hypothetical protein
MEIPAVTGGQVTDALRDAFYQVVPLQYQTHCVLTAQICCRVLRHFGINSWLEPCQLWWVAPGRNFVVGFFQKAHELQWEGHVICRGDNFLIDAALHHVQRELGVDVPNIVVGDVFDFRSNVISRYDLSHDTRLWWHRPPHELDIEIPEEPEDLIMQYVDELISKLELSLGAGGHASAQLVPAQWQSVPSLR